MAGTGFLCRPSLLARHWPRGARVLFRRQKAWFLPAAFVWGACGAEALTGPSSRSLCVIQSLLVANRGEIACRIFRTARRLGIRTIAVFSDADASAQHVKQADEAVRIGPAAPRESYLDIQKILAAARATGAQAIHPGYGFLSENAQFAQACVDAGLIFVGPPPSAISAMGSKIVAKARMRAKGVQVLPGYEGATQDLAHLQ